MFNRYNNGNMYQRSLIQQIMEYEESLGGFKKSLMDLLENYNVKDNVFEYSSNKLNEVCSGYFIIESTHDNLQDAIRSVNNFSKCIRVVDNDTFQVGTIVNRYSEIGDNRAIDLDTREEVL